MKGKKNEEKKKNIHPYIPNSVPEIKAAMLAEIGIRDIEELYADIPEKLRYAGELDLPAGLDVEFDLKEHVNGILSKNKTAEENICFLGGGCWPHYVPAICDEINQRSEFLTAYAGEPYEDHGRFQALFEYESLMAEILDMDVVNVPTYDWSQAAATSVRMAGRITGRMEILVADTISPERLAVIKNYCHPAMRVRMVGHDPRTGQICMDDLLRKIHHETAGVYFENPAYLGPIEEQGEDIAGAVHGNGSLCLVGADPLSLGLLIPPVRYGADIVCGDIQGLGNPMSFGGGQGGFIASCDDKKYVMEYPSRLFGITPTAVAGEYGFGDVAYERTSFAEREEGKEFVGTQAALCGITAAVYLSLLGPQGLADLGRTIVQRSSYAAKELNEIPGIAAPGFASTFFKEFVVDFNGTGMKVEEINARLRDRGIFGGKDLSKTFPGIGQCALYCITEIHSKAHIDRLVRALKMILRTDTRGE